MTNPHAAAVALCAVALVGSLPLAPSAARAMPQTVGYTCTPSWPEGGYLTTDWNSGHKSITATFPNGSEMNMAIEKGGSSFLYGEADTEIYGRNQSRVMVREGGEPLRTCIAR
jgi:hypothetical protein